MMEMRYPATDAAFFCPLTPEEGIGEFSQKHSPFSKSV
jgi:hypothetical protein